MGNAEFKALLDGIGAIDDDALLSLHRQYSTYGDPFFPLERTAFALLFKGVRFAVVDQVYDALLADAERRQGVCNYRDLCAALIMASTLPQETKARVLHETVLAVHGEITVDQVTELIALSVSRCLVPFRGEEDPSGKIAYPAYRCFGCRKVPTNLVFGCLDCPTGAASVFGVSSGVFLCSGCSSTWEGTGPNHVHHDKNHRLAKIKSIANPKALSFAGIMCSSCGMFPIVGPRLHCVDCTDSTELCNACYSEGLLPGAHSAAHVLEPVTTAQTLGDEIYRYLFELGFAPPSPPALPSKWAVAMAGKISRKEPTRIGVCAADIVPITAEDLATAAAWQKWVESSERLLPVLGGRVLHHVVRCEDRDSYECVEMEQSRSTRR